jgi:hypothetical protein
MKDKNLETSIHYKVLEAMAGEFKMEALEVLQMGEDKLKELESSAPILFRYMRAMKPVFEGKKTAPEWVNDLYDTYQLIKKYLVNIQNIAKGVHLLPAQGWYFSIEFIDAFSFEDPDELLVKDPALFETEAIETFQRQATKIHTKLLEGHPKRKLMIDAIFRLHEAGEYFAAIPLALAQADV